MDTKVTKLQSRRMIQIKKNLKEIKFSKLKSKFFSNLREELIKKGWKMPKVQKKLESSKLNRVLSPANFRTLKQRLISPTNKRSNASRVNHSNWNVPTISPIIKKKMFIDFTSDQIELIDKIKNRIAETRSFRYQGFISPRVLTRTFFKEFNMPSSINGDYFRDKSKESFTDNFLTNQSYANFEI